MFGGVNSYSALAIAGAASRPARIVDPIETQSAQAGDPSNPATDSVTLSRAAQDLLAGTGRPADLYQQMMPTREGFSSANLANAVTDPGAEPFSAGKSFAEVGAAARAELDKQYSAMAATGEPFDYNSWEARDWYSAFGQLDRRALAAVRNNEGGLFTAQEREIASTIMTQQQSLATGQFAGPTRLLGSITDPYLNDEAGRQRAAIGFLDRVSDDEKATIPWAFARAGAQSLVKAFLEDSGAGLAGFDELESDSPLVKVIAAALDKLRQSGAANQGNGQIESLDDLKRQPWFQGFESQIDEAIAATAEDSSLTTAA